MNNSSDLIPPKWPLKAFYGMSIVSFPLYFTVFVCLLRLRCLSKAYSTTFYSILLQHYDKLETMAIIAEQSVIKRNTLMALIVVGLTCIFCFLAYARQVYRTVTCHKYKVSEVQVSVNASQSTKHSVTSRKEGSRRGEGGANQRVIFA
ncbi:hypothetical protein L5515_010966 [Caenorhabditis briggsae]|uniref:Uncharacterized protein n=1 Tax=Caenorhabditis briggsae TaxID=6238 RepID=A0AAE9ETD8_CAEBR|nr:hypothetical protein L5515_010966 [Caenorhabditis briggsae]